MGDFVSAVLKSRPMCPQCREPNSGSQSLQQRVYCQAPSKGVGDKPQIHSHFFFKLGISFFFLRVRTKTGINWLVTFLNHSFGTQDVLFCESQTRGSMARGSVSSSCPGETSWVCMLTMKTHTSDFSTLAMSIGNIYFSHRTLVGLVLS